MRPVLKKGVGKEQVLGEIKNFGHRKILTYFLLLFWDIDIFSVQDHEFLFSSSFQYIFLFV